MRDKLIANAENGRGLWIGMPADRSPQHEIHRLEIEELNQGFVSLNDGTHVTLAHMGKHCDKRIVEGVISACEVLQQEIFECAVSIEGVARFTNHIVMLLAPDQIDNAFDKTWSALGARACRPDSSFAGVRHVTVCHVRKGTETVKLPRINKYALTFRELTITCGDAVLSLPLAKIEWVF